MSVTLRVIQTFDPAREEEFLRLERRFAALERARPDLPQGRRQRMLLGGLPVHTLVWEGDFPDLATAWSAFTRYGADPQHEELAAQQRPLLRTVLIEALQDLA